MPIQVTFRASNTDNVLTAPAEKTVYVKGIAPSQTPLGSVQERVGLTLRNRKGARWRYEVACWEFSLEDAADSGLFQDQGDLDALEEVLKLYEFLWLYAVSGSTRKDADGNDYWSTHNLPVAVVLDGDAEPVTAWDMGAMAYEFELRSVSAHRS